MTGRENLRYTAKLNGIARTEAEARIDELLAEVRLTDAADQEGRDVLARHAPAARHRGRAGEEPVRAHPRRADDRDRPGRRGGAARAAPAPRHGAQPDGPARRRTSSARSRACATGSGSSRPGGSSPPGRSTSSPAARTARSSSRWASTATRRRSTRRARRSRASGRVEPSPDNDRYRVVTVDRRRRRAARHGARRGRAAARPPAAARRRPPRALSPLRPGGHRWPRPLTRSRRRRDAPRGPSRRASPVGWLADDRRPRSSPTTSAASGSSSC